MKTINFIQPQSIQTTKKEFFWWVTSSCILIFGTIAITIFLYMREHETHQKLEQANASHKIRSQQFQDLEQEVTQLSQQHTALQTMRDQYKHKNDGARKLKNIIQHIYTLVHDEQSETTSLHITLKNFDVRIKTPTIQSLNGIIENLSTLPEIASSMLTSIQTKDQDILATIKGILK